MGGKHKKNVRSEKAKVKLKGAILPKGGNVTKTDFKVKKIVIRQQLKDINTAEIQSSRHLNVKECLTRLHHHNTSFRTEALRNLKEIITNHTEEVVTKHLGSVIQATAKLSLDIERDVRRESFKVLSMLLTASPTEYISPFFDILSSYLRCAMTHIQPAIQEDSLLMLDALLEYVPYLVALNSDKIFASFLDMISRLRTDSRPERTLTVNLGSKQTSVKWRSKVLDRLHGMLRAIIKEKLNDKYFNVDEAVNVAENLLEDAFTIDKDEQHVHKTTKKGVNEFSSTLPMFFPLTKTYLTQNCSLPLLFNKSLNKATTNILEIADEGKKIKFYVETLMPLLYESWLEVRPINQDEENKAEASISNEAAFTLKIILQITELLWELIQIWDNEVNNQDLTKWFMETYSKDFCSHLIVAFPYTQGESKRGKKKKGDTTEKDVDMSGGIKCFTQNLTICYLFCSFDGNLHGNNLGHCQKIVNYVKKCIHQNSFKEPEIYNQFLKVLRSILLQNGVNWTNSDLKTKDIIKQLIQQYQQTKLPKEIRVKILMLLCDIVLKDDVMRIYGSEIFQEWIPTLPEMLKEEQISYHALNTFSSLGKQNNKLFISSLEQNSIEILKNLPKINILGIEDEFEGKKLILNLFYWLKINTNNSIVLNTVESYRNDLSDDLFEYAKQILN